MSHAGDLQARASGGKIPGFDPISVDPSVADRDPRPLEGFSCLDTHGLFQTLHYDHITMAFFLTRL